MEDKKRRNDEYGSDFGFAHQTELDEFSLCVPIILLRVIIGVFRLVEFSAVFLDQHLNALSSFYTIGCHRIQLTLILNSELTGVPLSPKRRRPCLTDKQIVCRKN